MSSNGDTYIDQLRGESRNLKALLHRHSIDWEKKLSPRPDSANQVFIEKADLPPALINRLIRLAAFQNPGLDKAQAIRLSVWDKPRIICCAKNYPKHIGLPRGCLTALEKSLLRPTKLYHFTPLSHWDTKWTQSPFLPRKKGPEKSPDPLK